MNGQSRRQWLLLGLLGVAIFVYFRFGGAALSSSGESIGNLPPIDADGLVRGLEGVSTVKPGLIDRSSRGEDAVAERNLFQYGPPRIDPAVLEAQRRAEEQRLLELEALARAQKEREQQAPPPPPEPQPIAQELPPPPPPAPVKPPPPPINYKFVGIMGPPRRKVGVLLDGDKVVLARQGEVIAGKFKVLDIGHESLEMGYVDPEHKDIKKRIKYGL